MSKDEDFKISHVKLGVEGLDKQHKKILKDISNILTSSSEEDVLFLKKIQELKKIMFKHYETEEKFMKDNSYTEHDAHKSEHNKLKKLIEELETETANGNISLCRRYELLEILLKGLLLQIHRYDKQMIDFLYHKYEDKFFS
ncbi:MAG TPA: hemerythrin domain-containing protein [Victivallales bacterium]|nr:hemerythrin domain-containing protein [Victivallales bacterium]